MEVGDKTDTKAVKHDVFSQFSKFTTISDNFYQKSMAVTKNEDKPNSIYISKFFSTTMFLWKSCCFLDFFWQQM